MKGRREGRGDGYTRSVRARRRKKRAYPPVKKKVGGEGGELSHSREMHPAFLCHTRGGVLSGTGKKGEKFHSVDEGEKK